MQCKYNKEDCDVSSLIVLKHTATFPSWWCRFIDKNCLSLACFFPEELRGSWISVIQHFLKSLRSKKEKLINLEQELQRKICIPRSLFWVHSFGSFISALYFSKRRQHCWPCHRKQLWKALFLPKSSTELAQAWISSSSYLPAKM